MVLIERKDAVTNESADVPDEALIATLSPSHATHLLLSVCFVCVSCLSLLSCPLELAPLRPGLFR